MQTPQCFQSSQYQITKSTNVVKGHIIPSCLLRFRELGYKDLQAKVLNISNNFELQREINSPFVVRSYQLIVGANEPAIIQEPYDTTVQNICPKDLKYEQKLSIISDLSEAVKNLQTNRLVNLGLKPSKIALFKIKEGYRAKIIFLDEVQILNEKMTEAIVSPSAISTYSAPQVHLTGKCSQQSDIWSLGYLFYFLLFGSHKGIKVWKEEVAVEFPNGTPSWMQEILSRMLAYNPTKRYSIYEVMDRMKFMKQCASIAARFMPASFD